MEGGLAPAAAEIGLAGCRMRDGRAQQAAGKQATCAGWLTARCCHTRLCRAAPDAKLNDIKALLGKMLFSGAGMEKKVGAAGLVGLWVGSPAGGCEGWQWAQQSALGHCHSAVSHMQEKATLRRACDCPGCHLYTTSAALTSQPCPCRRRLSG